MRTSHESVWASLIPWVGELLPTLHQGLLSQGGALDRFAQEKSNVALVRRVPMRIRGVEEGNFRGTCSRSSGPHQALQSANGCLRLRHWWSSHVRRPPHSVRESKVKWYGTPLHGARKWDDCNHTLLANVATLLAWLTLHDYDGQRSNKLLPNAKEVEP